MGPLNPVCESGSLLPAVREQDKFPSLSPFTWNEVEQLL